MKHLTIALITIFATCSAWSGSNLLDLLKANKAKYSTVSCQNFIQKATHNSLRSPELLRHTVLLKDFKYLDDYFFHYTDAPIIKTTLESSISDRSLAQRKIVQKGGYKSIMEYQMTYADALSNIQGVGFYVSANPFSSSSYGNTQVALRFSPNSRLIDSSAKINEINAAIAARERDIPEFASCASDLQFSLMMNENGIDAALYSDAHEWLVVFNEDIIIESHVNTVVSETSAAIIQEMVRLGLVSALPEYITEMGMTNAYRIPLSRLEAMIPAGQKVKGKSSLLTIAGYLKNWTETTKLAFARLISSKKAVEMQALMNEFRIARLITDDVYFKIALNQASDDFISMIVAKIKSAPALAKAWGSLYDENMSLLFKKSHIDIGFYLSNFPSAAKRGEFYGSLASKDFSAQQDAQVIEYMLATDPAYFQKLGQEEKYDVFNTFLRGTSADRISSFIANIERLGYNTKSSFDFIVSRPNSYGANGYAFLASYIKFKRDPALLTDGLIKVLLSRADFNASEFTIYLKQNQAAFGAGASKFSTSSLSVMNVSFLDGLMRPEYVRLFSKAETDLILSRLLQNDAEGSKLIGKFVSVFGYSAASLAQLLSTESPRLKGTGDSVVAVLRAIEVDGAEWAKFTSFSNSSGLLSLLGHGSLASAKSYALSRTQALFLRDPSQISKLPVPMMRSLLTASNLTPYFAAYSDDQKLSVVILMKSVSSADADGFMARVSFNPALVSSFFDSLMAQASDDHRDFEALLNNENFVAPLTGQQFETLVSKAVSFNKRLDLKLLIRSDVLTFERALALILKLDRSHGADNISEIADHQLSFADLSESNKRIVVSKFVDGFEDLSSQTRSALWERVFESLIATKETTKLILKTGEMSLGQRSEYLNHQTSSPALIEESLKSFGANRVKFYETVLASDSREAVASLLGYVESVYPVKEAYYIHMIRHFGEARNSRDVQNLHLKSYVCKKVKKFYAFDELIDNEKNKEAKEYYKYQRKQICKS